MNWEAIGAIGEIVGAVAVVFTLIYLTIQLRQNTATVKAATYQAVAEALADSAYRLAPIPKDEHERVVIFIGTMRRFENLHFQLKSQNVKEADIEGFLNGLALSLDEGSYGKYWKPYSIVFNSEFVDYVETYVMPRIDGIKSHVEQFGGRIT